MIFVALLDKNLPAHLNYGHGSNVQVWALNTYLETDAVRSLDGTLHAEVDALLGLPDHLRQGTGNESLLHISSEPV